MDNQEKSSERVNQKRRTRSELVRAAHALIDQGLRPTVAEVADHASISRATAYRYFSTPEELIREAVLDGVAARISVLPLPADAAPERVAQVIDKLVTDVFRMVAGNETVFRALIATSPPDSPGRRGGRRIEWVRQALAPLTNRLNPEEMDKLVHALALLIGIEALIVMRDVCDLSPSDGEKVVRWAARSLLDQALGNTPAASEVTG